MVTATVRYAVMDVLRTLDMTTVFGNPGSTELGFLHEWPRDFRYVLGLQESVVVGMADGYAQATGTAACVNLHSAAGVGHALGSIFTAYRNHTPLVITAGQQVRELMPLRPFLGAAAAADFPRPYVKFSCEPARAEDVPLAITQAHHIAMQKPCGPAFVSIPADDWSRPAEPVPLLPKSREFAADPELLRVLTRAINAANRPALVVGAGVARDRAHVGVLQMAEVMQASVWSEPLASRAAFPESHALFAGFLPAAPEAMAAILERYDLIVVLGAAAFTLHVSGDLRRLRGIAPVFQITDEPELAATALSAISILGNVRLAIASILSELKSRAPRSGVSRPPREPVAAREPLPAEWVLQTISSLRASSSIVVEEAPSHRQALQRYLPIDNHEFYAMASGGLGFGVAAAVGIALGRPGQDVICVVGDGSAMYSIQALWTAAQLKLPVTYIVLNNSGYGALKGFSRLTGTSSAPGLDLPRLDFVALARGLGCSACRVTEAAELAPVLRAAFDTRLPTLIEVAVSQDLPKLFRGGGN